MKLNHFFGFAVCILAMCVILSKISFNEQRVALHKLESQLERDFSLGDKVEQGCYRVMPQHKTVAERFVAQKLSPMESKATENCSVFLASTSTQRFRLRSYWNFALLLRSESGNLEYKNVYRVEFPRPLTLLPFAILLLALVFDFPLWGVGLTLGSYLFLLSGANLKAMFSMVGQNSQLAMQTDQTLWGLLLLCAWLALFRSNTANRFAPRNARAKAQSWVARVIYSLVGFWSPAVFTISSRLVTPFQRSVRRLGGFLDAQFFVLCLSLYLLSFDAQEIGTFIEQSLLLPRYFTFSALLFVGFAGLTFRNRILPLPWNLPGAWRASASVLILEVCSATFGIASELPTLTRIGIALVASELLWPVSIRWGAALRTFSIWGGAVFISALLAITSVESGMADLTMILFDPRMHPTAIVLFTFLSGICMGFFTGSFVVSYFALMGILLTSLSQPLVKAALLDGIVAGVLVSPFSLFNLLPAVQYKINFQELLRTRFKQVLMPLTIGAIIYAIASVNSVAILRPATFVFLCLIGIATRLKQGRWLVGDLFRPIAPTPAKLEETS